MNKKRTGRDIRQTLNKYGWVDITWVSGMFYKGYGGLYSGVCGCKLADLAPMRDCGDSILDCQAGYENKCNDVEDECEYNGSGCTSCITPNKPEATDAENDD